MTSQTPVGVSRVAARISGAQARFSGSPNGTASDSHLNTPQARLRGSMEHFSYESSANRYMRGASRRSHYRVNLLFRLFAAVVFGVIVAAYVFVLS